MFASTRKHEIFIEIVPMLGKLVDWDFSQGENHLWVGRVHLVINRKPTGGEYGQSANRYPDESTG